MKTLSEAIFDRGLVEQLELKKEMKRLRARWVKPVPLKIPTVSLHKDSTLTAAERTRVYVLHFDSANSLVHIPPTFLDPCDLGEEQQEQPVLEEA